MVSSQSLYRKWRSQTFAEIVGQEHITRTLLNALRTGRVAHAYLFCGPRGTGKTSSARLLAKAVNCLRNEGRGEPCNECALCRSIIEGRSLDVVEIDGASNRGIDEIRDLREKVNFAPGEASRKLYIIDEVHQLTPEAFNALLKTLEEPPAHTIFVLASTEPHKIPATILSRCQRFDFRRIPVRAIAERLRHICQEEDIEIEAAALDAIARSATGSLRDAESLLDQLRAYADGPVTVAQVGSLLGTRGTAAVRELVAEAFRRDLGRGLRLINRLADDGNDMRQIGREVVDYLRGLLLVKTGATPAEQLDVTAETAASMGELAGEVALEDVVRALRLFSQADFAARGLVQPQLPLEMAFAEVVLGDGVASASQPATAAVAAQSAAPREAAAPPVPAPRLAQRPAAAVRAEGVVERAAATAGPARRGASTPRDATPAPERRGDEPTATAATAGEVPIERLRQAWATVLDAVGRADKKVQALLRDSTGPERVEDNTVVLAFVHAFHKDQIDQAKNRSLVESAIASLLGQQCFVRCELASRQEQGRQAPASVLEDPLVREALSQGGRIKGVRNTSAKETTTDDAE